MKNNKLAQQLYSHPLLKQVDSVIEEDHSQIIPTYFKLKPNNTRGVSNKFLRQTTLKPSLKSSFSIFLQPFN